MPRLNTYDPPLISALVKFHQWAKAHRINYAVLGGIAAGAWVNLGPHLISTSSFCLSP